MTPQFRRDVWLVLRAYAGFNVVQKVRVLPDSAEAYAARLRDAAIYLGLPDELPIIYDAEQQAFLVGAGVIRPTRQVLSEVENDDDAPDEDVDLLALMVEITALEDYDDDFDEDIIEEDDENDTYGFPPPVNPEANGP